MNTRSPSRRPRDVYKTPWLLRDVYGAPVWGIIVFVILIAGVVALALTMP